MRVCVFVHRSQSCRELCTTASWTWSSGGDHTPRMVRGVECVGEWRGPHAQDGGRGGGVWGSGGDHMPRMVRGVECVGE